jgi:redox-sensitive bicupin YhaK (pirin superfamily)
MNNVEILKRGDIQLTSTGTGIRHAEHQHGSKQVHFLQIWAFPHTSNLAPRYFTRHFSDEAKRLAWVPVVAPVGTAEVKHEREAEGPAPVQSPLILHATILAEGVSRPHTLPAASAPGLRKAYVHVVQTGGYHQGPAKGATVRLAGPDGVEATLREGDGAYIWGEAGRELQVENVGGGTAEVLLFDLDVDV